MWIWIKDKLLGPVITAAIIALLAFLVGVVGLPGRVGRLEKQTDKIPEIFKTVGEFGANLTNFKEASDKALVSVNDFDNKLFDLGEANGELKAHVENLNGLKEEIKELRKSIDDLRITIAKLPGELKQDAEQSFEISALVFLTQENLVREGDLFVAQLEYPERLLRGRNVQEIRTRLSAIQPVPGLSSITALAKPEKTGYNLRLIAEKPDAVSQFLNRQPIRVEVIFVIGR